MINISLNKYSINIKFDVKKSFTADRKNEIIKLFDNDFTIEKGRDALKVYNRNLNNYFSRNIVILEEYDINKLYKLIRSIERIYSININELGYSNSLETSYNIQLNVEENDYKIQTDALANLVGNTDLMITQVEFFDLINDKGVFVLIQVLPSGLRITTTLALKNIEEIEEVVDSMNFYINNNLIKKIEKSEA